MSVLDPIIQWMAHGRYNVTEPTYTDGEQAELQTTSNGRLKVEASFGASDGVKLWNNPGVATSERIVKNTSGKLYRILVSNPGVADAFLFVFNASARPSNGSTAEIVPPIKILAGADAEIGLDLDPYDATVGIYWGASSTHDDFTYDATATLKVATRYG
jgi:hypothetical protein